MFGGQHSRPLIEHVYLRNDKNFDLTLDQFLNNKNIPKDEYKVTVISSQKQEQLSEIINTSSTTQQPIKEKQSDLLQQYMLGYFEGSKSRKQKNRRYYEEHQKVMERK